jgi:hypothetical protein
MHLSGRKGRAVGIGYGNVAGNSGVIMARHCHDLVRRISQGGE